MRRTPGAKLWQRGYHEHIVRDENKWNRNIEDTAANPQQWPHDRKNPATGLGTSSGP